MKIKDILLKTSQSVAFSPLRIGVGIVMSAHGAQKLFGWFGGYGLQATGQFFADTLGLKPGLLLAAFAGSAEFFGGLLLITGLFTRLAGVAIAGTMGIAILTVHNSAFFANNNGMEYPLILILASSALVIGGGGSFSLDQQLAHSE